MIKCILFQDTENEKTYTIPFVTGRAMREMEPAWELYMKMLTLNEKAQNGEEVEDDTKMSDVMDVVIDWFVKLFGNQFTVDEFYDGYPADKVLSDIFLALNCVRKSMSEVLDEFPTKPVMPKTETKKTTTSRK